MSPSLPDAEVREDVVEDVLRIDFAGDGAEVVQSGAEGGGAQVGRQPVGESEALGDTVGAATVGVGSAVPTGEADGSVVPVTD